MSIIYPEELQYLELDNVRLLGGGAPYGGAPP